METPSLPDFNFNQTFFGLSPDYGFYLQNLIFDIIWQSNGRFDWNTLYYMPIHIRNLYAKRVTEIISDK